MLNELLGRIAYEAAAAETGCAQPWEEANKAKWIAAAQAVYEHMKKVEGYVFVMHPDDQMLRELDGQLVFIQRTLPRHN